LKGIVFQLIKKFPAFYRGQIFNRVFKKSRHLFLACVRSIQYTHTHTHVSTLIPILVLSHHVSLGLQNGLSFTLLLDTVSTSTDCSSCNTRHSFTSYEKNKGKRKDITVHVHATKAHKGE
jgi:hypothetical protein